VSNTKILGKDFVAGIFVVINFFQIYEIILKFEGKNEKVLGGFRRGWKV
jgi:hypothetical protein